MDPDANLKEQEELAKKLVESEDGHDGGEFPIRAQRLAELVLAMKEWRAKLEGKPYIHLNER